MTPTVLTRLPWGHRGSTVLADVAESQLLVLTVCTVTQGR